jgi:hypothetical protein
MSGALWLWRLGMTVVCMTVATPVALIGTLAIVMFAYAVPEQHLDAFEAVGTAALAMFQAALAALLVRIAWLFSPVARRVSPLPIALGSGVAFWLGLALFSYYQSAMGPDSPIRSADAWHVEILVSVVFSGAGFFAASLVPRFGNRRRVDSAV